MKSVPVALAVVLSLGSLAAAQTAPATQPSEARQRADGLKANLEKFVLDVEWYGIEDRPMPRVHLQVAELGEKPLFGAIKIDKAAAQRVIEYLLKSGYLDRSRDMALKNWKPAFGNYYALEIKCDAEQPMHLREAIGYGPETRKVLLDLRDALGDGDAAKSVDGVLSRIPKP